jgi:hypothetical protein
VEAAHGQAGDELRALAGADHAEAVGLVLVAGQLGDEFVVADPGAGRQIGFGLDAGADQLGNAGGAADAFQILRHVEIGLVQRQGSISGV